jgi:hypothetical protein
MPARRAGQHARQTSRTLAVRLIFALAALVAVGVTVVASAGFDPRAAMLAELVTVVAAVALDRRTVPCVQRWTRGARGEEAVGAMLDALRGSGWRTIHDVDTGRGNIDHVVIGPGGVLTVEPKSHGGRIAIDRLEEAGRRPNRRERVAALLTAVRQHRPSRS